MSVMISRLFGDWRHLVEKPASAEDVEPAVERGSIPAYAFYQGTVFVRGDIVASPGLFTQELINALRDKLSEMVTMPVILEFGIIPEMILRSVEEVNVDG